MAEPKGDGERLLELVREFVDAREAIAWGKVYDDVPAPRTPAEIGAEYEAVLRRMLAP